MIRTGWLVLLASLLHIGWGISVHVWPSDDIIPGMILMDRLVPHSPIRAIIYMAVGISSLIALRISNSRPTVAFIPMSIQMSLLLMGLFGALYALGWPENVSLHREQSYIFRNQLALVLLVLGHVAVLTEIIWTRRLSWLYQRLLQRSPPPQ